MKKKLILVVVIGYMCGLNGMEINFLLDEEPREQHSSSINRNEVCTPSEQRKNLKRLFQETVKDTDDTRAKEQSDEIVPLVCAKKSRNLSEFSQEIIADVQAKKNTCNYCDAWFSQSEFLLRHIQQLHDREYINSLSASFIDVPKVTIEDASSNNSVIVQKSPCADKTTSVIKVWSCLKCKEDLLSKKLLIEHYRKVCIPQDGQCFACTFFKSLGRPTYNDRYVVTKHMTKPHNLKLKCKFCPEVIFTSVGEQLLHENTISHIEKRKNTTKIH